MSVAAPPLMALGVPVISVSRPPADVSSSSNAVVNLSRLLDRLEGQIGQLGMRGRDTDSWKAASIPVALTHAGTSLAGIQSDRGVTPELVALRTRLQRLTQQYMHVHSRPERQSRSNNLHNGLSRAAAREVLLKDMTDDSDADSEFEDNSEQVMRALKARHPPPEQSVEEAEHGPVKHAGQHDEDYDEYEQAATLRRRTGGDVVSNKAEEKEEQGGGSPSALQSERSVQDSLAAELLRMAGVLKTNSVKFADSLENDRKVLEQADEKLQGNLTLMTKTRGRLGEYSRKARGMGCMTLGAVAMVCMSWAVMFVLIRLT